MDPWVGDKVSLEFCDVHVDGPIKPQRSGEG